MLWARGLTGAVASGNRSGK